MGKFKRAAVLGATVLAITGATAGAAQAATEHKTETPGHVATDCHSAQTQREMQMGSSRKVVIDYCTQEKVGAGSTPTMMIHWHYA